LYRFDRRFAIREADRPTDHVHSTTLKATTVMRIAPELRWPKITHSASAGLKSMAWYLLKEPPKIEVLNAAITVDVVTRRALAQTNETQSICIWSGVLPP
jgi:hypothetical protein